MLSKKEFEAHITLPSVIDAISFDFTEDKLEEARVARIAEWLNDVVKKGAVYFHSGNDGDSVILVAFSEIVSENSLNKIRDVNWDAYFSSD